MAPSNPLLAFPGGHGEPIALLLERFEEGMALSNRRPYCDYRDFR